MIPVPNNNSVAALPCVTSVSHAWRQHVRASCRGGGRWRLRFCTGTHFKNISVAFFCMAFKGEDVLLSIYAKCGPTRPAVPLCCASSTFPIYGAGRCFASQSSQTPEYSIRTPVETATMKVLTRANRPDRKPHQPGRGHRSGGRDGLGGDGPARDPGGAGQVQGVPEPRQLLRGHSGGLDALYCSPNPRPT